MLSLFVLFMSKFEIKVWNKLAKFQFSHFAFTINVKLVFESSVHHLVNKEYIYTLVKFRNINIVNPPKQQCIKLIFHFKKSQKNTFWLFGFLLLNCYSPYYFLKQKKIIFWQLQGCFGYLKYIFFVWGGRGGYFGVLCHFDNFNGVLVSLKVLRVFWLFWWF